MDSRRIHLMKLSLSLALVGAMVFLSACEDEPPVRSTRQHPSRYPTAPPQPSTRRNRSRFRTARPRRRPTLSMRRRHSLPPPRRRNKPKATFPTEFPCRTSLVLSPARTRPIKAMWTSAGFLPEPKSKTRTRTRSFSSPKGRIGVRACWQCLRVLRNGLSAAALDKPAECPDADRRAPASRVDAMSRTELIELYGISR